MSFTVTKALDMEIFQKCTLLTGEAGLQNEILWVNILEILDDLSHIEPGEFLITTAHGFDTHSESKQQAMIEFFAARKLAAVAVQTGHYLEKIPLSFIRFSEENNIPLIEIPPEISFKSLTRALLNELMRIGRETEPGLAATDGERLETLAAEMKDLWQRLVDYENPDDLRREMKKHDLEPHIPCLAMVLARQGSYEGRMLKAGETEHEFIGALEKTVFQILIKKQIPFLIGPSGHSLPLMIQSEQLKGRNPSTDLIFARDIADELQRIYHPGLINIGLSSVHSDIGKLKQALEEAEKAQQAAQLELLDDTNLVSFREMNLYRLILDYKNVETLKGIFCETTAPLLEYDLRSKGALMLTLKIYLQYLNIKKAAEVLFIHRHTLRYRLQQIEELTGFNPLLPNDALQLNIGLHIYHYLKASNILN
jgi:PucR family transcriptional regulator, purine catabolism regulatory protein